MGHSYQESRSVSKLLRHKKREKWENKRGIRAQWRILWKNSCKRRILLKKRHKMKETLYTTNVCCSHFLTYVVGLCVQFSWGRQTIFTTLILHLCVSHVPNNAQFVKTICVCVNVLMPPPCWKSKERMQDHFLHQTKLNKPKGTEASYRRNHYHHKTYQCYTV